MSEIEDDCYAIDYLHQEMLRTLLKRFEELPNRQRLQAIRYTINIHLERYQKEDRQPRVAVFKGLKLLIDKLKSVKELERLVSEKSEFGKVQK